MAQLTSPLVTLVADSASANMPPKWSAGAFTYDRKGGFWLFGGNFDNASGNYFPGSLWRYNRDSNIFTFVDGSNLTNAAAILPNKPTPRSSMGRWVDNEGNLYLFGGNGYNETGNVVGE